jgi:hypothetical protein
VLGEKVPPVNKEASRSVSKAHRDRSTCLCKHCSSQTNLVKQISAKSFQQQMMQQMGGMWNGHGRNSQSSSYWQQQLAAAASSS